MNWFNSVNNSKFVTKSPCHKRESCKTLLSIQSDGTYSVTPETTALIKAQIYLIAVNFTCILIQDFLFHQVQAHNTL